MTVYSGKDAYVNTVGCVQSWQATEAVTAQRYSASCVPGATAVPPGIVNWTGQISGVGDFPEVVIPNGTDLAFQGVINNTSMALKSLTGNVRIEQLTIDIDKSTYAPIKWTATFGAQGLLTEGATGAADATISEAPNGKDLAISIGGTPLTQSLTKAQIVLRMPATTYVDAGATKRTSGNLECDVNFTVQDSSLAVGAYAKNVLGLLKIFTTADNFWEFSKIRFLGKSNFTVDRVSNNVLGYQVNGQWSAIEADALGYLTFFNGFNDLDTYTDVYGTNPY